MCGSGVGTGLATIAIVYSMIPLAHLQGIIVLAAAGAGTILLSLSVPPTGMVVTHLLEGVFWVSASSGLSKNSSKRSVSTLDKIAFFLYFSYTV